MSGKEDRYRNQYYPREQQEIWNDLIGRRFEYQLGGGASNKWVPMEIKASMGFAVQDEGVRGPRPYNYEKIQAEGPGVGFEVYGERLLALLVLFDIPYYQTGEPNSPLWKKDYVRAIQ